MRSSLDLALSSLRRARRQVRKAQARQADLLSETKRLQAQVKRLQSTVSRFKAHALRLFTENEKSAAAGLDIFSGYCVARAAREGAVLVLRSRGQIAKGEGEERASRELKTLCWFLELGGAMRWRKGTRDSRAVQVFYRHENTTPDDLGGFYAGTIVRHTTVRDDDGGDGSSPAFEVRFPDETFSAYITLQDRVAPLRSGEIVSVRIS